MYIDKAEDYINDDMNVIYVKDDDIVLQVTKSELETIKEALYEAAEKRDLLRSQRFGVLNRTIEDFLRQNEGEDFLRQNEGEDDDDYLPF